MIDNGIQDLAFIEDLMHKTSLNELVSGVLEGSRKNPDLGGVRKIGVVTMKKIFASPIRKQAVGKTNATISGVLHQNRVLSYSIGP